MPFKKGWSGNPKGASRTAKLFRDALMLSVNRKIGGVKIINILAEKLVAEAEKGNLMAIKEVADRLDGRPAQQTTLSGDPDAQLFPDHVTLTVVDPANPDR